MESEKETSEACNKQEGKNDEKIKDDAGCVEAGKLEKKDGIGEMKQEVEDEEMKEVGAHTGEDEGVKEQQVEEKGEEEEVEEATSGGEDDDDGDREGTGTEKKSAATNLRKKRTTETAELSSPRTPVSDRPTRERKTVERFTVNESARSSTPKPWAIEKVL